MKNQWLSLLSLACAVLLPATALGTFPPLTQYTSKQDAVTNAINQRKMILLVSGTSGCGDCLAFENGTLYDPSVYPMVTNALVYWNCQEDPPLNCRDYMTYTSDMPNFPLPLVCIIDPTNADHFLGRWFGGGGAASANSNFRPLLLAVSKPEISNVTVTATNITVQGTNRWVSLNASIKAVSYRIGNNVWQKTPFTNGTWSAGPFDNPGGTNFTFSAYFANSSSQHISATNTVVLDSGGTPIVNTNGTNAQSITFAALPPKTYGDPPFGLTASADSGLLVSFTSLNTNVATISGTNLTIVGAGTAVIRASQPGDTNYSATSLSRTQTVSQAALTITANNDSKAYGQIRSYGAGSTAFTSGALQNSETIGSVTITASGGTAANAAVDSYDLTPGAATGGTFTAGNYSITYHNGTLTVNQAALTVTADNKSRPFGAANPPLTATITGFVNGDTRASAVTGSPDISTAATATNVAGTYPITVVLGNLAAANYTFASFVNGTLTVTTNDTLPPGLVITSHVDLQEVTTNKITLRGTASDAGLGDSGIKSVTVNGVPAANGAASSNNVATWSLVVNLSPGTNALKVVATDNAPAHNSTTNVIRIISDTVRPICLITSPVQNQRWSNAVFTVKGTAKDNLQVAGVWCQTNGVWGYASPSNNNWANWSVAVALAPGSNTVRAYAVDAAGNKSLTNTVTFRYVLSDRLTLVTTGQGKLSPNYSNPVLEIGNSYTITATPGSGYVFSNWTGTVLGASVISSSTAALSFVMRSNLVLEADFVPNPFMALKGAYNGLFCPIINQQPVFGGATNAGFFTLALTANGAFSGRLVLQGTSLPFSGAFNVQLQALAQVARSRQPALTLNLQINPVTANLETNVITGTVSTGPVDYLADLLAYRAIAAGSNVYSGAYTLLVEGCEDDGACFGVLTNVPWGDSPATVQVSPVSGGIQMVGTLADGTAIGQAVAASEAGQWPLYASLYGGRGLLIGWVSLGQPSGLVYWLMPSSVNRFYTNGFSQWRMAELTKYTVPPLRQNAVAWTNAEVVFDGGNLSGRLTNQVVLSNNSLRVISGSINNLSLTINPNNGSFSGSFAHPANGRGTPFHGMVEQLLPAPDSLNGGWFLGPDGSGGTIRLHPNP